MGNIFRKKVKEEPPCPKETELKTFSVEITDLEKPTYQKLKPIQKRKLNAFCNDIIESAAVDNNNTELKDIRYAVYKMLERGQEKVNERGVFTISRIQPCGSMAEGSSVWKYDREAKETYTEFDFLAVLENSTDSTNVCDSSCPGCTKVKRSPVDLECLRQHYQHSADKLSNYIKEPATVDNLFQREFSWCLASSCDCLSVEYEDGYPGKLCRTIAFNSKHPHKPYCKKCSVEMPTGKLKINTFIKIEKYSGIPANCSLIFLWESKSKRLYAPVGFDLHRTHLVDSLAVYVDFIPALEPKLATRKTVKDTVIVAKQCSVSYHIDGWRKSSVLSEIDYMVNDMTEKHRNCYKIMKYLIQVAHACSSTSHYHVKTVAFNHSRICSDSSENMAECVLKMFCELLQAYHRKELSSFNQQANLLNKNCDTDHKWAAAYFNAIINRICSVSEHDSLATYVDKVAKTYNLCIRDEDYSGAGSRYFIQ